MHGTCVCFETWKRANMFKGSSPAQCHPEGLRLWWPFLTGECMQHHWVSLSSKHKLCKKCALIWNFLALLDNANSQQTKKLRRDSYVLKTAHLLPKNQLPSHLDNFFLPSSAVGAFFHRLIKNAPLACRWHNGWHLCFWEEREGNTCIDGRM